MFKLDNDFLQSLGLGGLPVDEKNKLLQMIYERLEMNVGMRLAEKMTDQQLDEFEGFIDRNDEAGALKWLETNFPNYKDVVAEELEKLKDEVTAAAPQILAAHSGTGQPGQVNAPQMTPIMSEPVMPGVPQPGLLAESQASPSFQQQPAFGSQSAPMPQPQMPMQQPAYPQPGYQPQTPPAPEPYGPAPQPQAPFQPLQPQPQPVAPAQPTFMPQPSAPQPYQPQPSLPTESQVNPALNNESQVNPFTPPPSDFTPGQ